MFLHLVEGFAIGFVGLFFLLTGFYSALFKGFPIEVFQRHYIFQIIHDLLLNGYFKGLDNMSRRTLIGRKITTII